MIHVFPVIRLAALDGCHVLGIRINPMASLSDSLPLRLAGVPHVAHDSFHCNYSDAAEETEKCCQGVWSNMTDWVFLKSRILHYDGS